MERRQPATTMDTPATSQNRPASSPLITEGSEAQQLTASVGNSASRFMLGPHMPHPLFAEPPFIKTSSYATELAGVTVIRPSRLLCVDGDVQFQL